MNLRKFLKTLVCLLPVLALCPNCAPAAANNKADFRSVLDKGFKLICWSDEKEKLAPDDIAAIERMINAKLPVEYRDYLSHSNGGLIVHPKEQHSNDGCMFLVHWPKANGVFPDTEFAAFNNFFEFSKNADNTEGLIYNYKLRQEFLPENTLPIGRDPGNNLILLGFGKKNFGKITYWRIVQVPLEKSFDYGEEEIGSIAYEGQVADSFVEFIVKMTTYEESRKLRGLPPLKP